ncbi:MAG: hypothetical protein IKW81_09690 [Pseudobutyrivibrio sp.]|nr:hypothetical protein [Pseudobutyrivibrio sp.]
MTEKQQATRDAIDFFYKLRHWTIDDVIAKSGVDESSIRQFMEELSYKVSAVDVAKMCETLAGSGALFFWIQEAFEGASAEERAIIYNIANAPEEEVLADLDKMMRIDLLKRRYPEKFENLCKENGII